MVSGGLLTENKQEAAFWGAGDGLYLVLGGGFLVDTYVNTHQSEPLRFVHFTIYILYFN